MRTTILFFIVSFIGFSAFAKLNAGTDENNTQTLGSKVVQQAGLLGWDRYYCEAHCVNARRFDISSMFSSYHATILTKITTTHARGEHKSETYALLVADCNNRRGVLLSYVSYNRFNNTLLDAEAADADKSCKGYDVSNAEPAGVTVDEVQTAELQVPNAQ